MTIHPVKPQEGDDNNTILALVNPGSIHIAPVAGKSFPVSKYMVDTLWELLHVTDPWRLLVIGFYVCSTIVCAGLIAKPSS